MTEVSTATAIARRAAKSAGADCYRNDNDGVLVITRADGEQMGVIDEDDGEGWTATERQDGAWEAVDGDDRTVVDQVERCVHQWVAQADVDGRALTATVTGRDAWGKERQVTVAWIPEDITAGVNDVTGWPPHRGRHRPRAAADRYWTLAGHRGDTHRVPPPAARRAARLRARVVTRPGRGRPGRGNVLDRRRQRRH